MDKDTADAITIIEKQMAEQANDIAALTATSAVLSDKVGKMALALQTLAAALKGFGQ